MKQLKQRTTEPLGINGLGRIGKLTVWNHVASGYFPKLVVNVGRGVGTSLEAVCQAIEKDSTYGSMHRFLFGVSAEPCIRIVDREACLLEVGSVPVTILQQARAPQDIGWREHGVRLVVDTTGAFGDPTLPADHAGGSLRGHLTAGAEKVINSAAFKIKDKTRTVPDDVVTLVYGINHECFDPTRHHLISAASCTTTALAHMVKPLLDRLDPSTLMTASMSTVHAVTNTQSVGDRLPKDGASDLRKNRSVLNSIILTSTNAATALEAVIPRVRHIGFMADSVRVPISTESLIILNVTFQSGVDAEGRSNVTKETLNGIYAATAAGPQRGLLVYSEEQNVSADVTGMKAAVVIEGVETHTRTGSIRLDLTRLSVIDPATMARLRRTEIEVPVTHAKIFGWYDNEYGSYTNLMGDLTQHVEAAM